MDEKDPTHTIAVLKELSDIKSNLSSNTTETANIKQSISEIKIDIHEIKNDFVSRREFNDGLISIRDEVAPLKKFVYGLITIFGLAIIGAILRLVIK